MSTSKQIAANRRNAKKSTGPRTSAGKTQSALNARKHGFAGSTFTVIRLEDNNDIDNLRQDAIDCYRPMNSQEIFAVERIAICQAALLRIARLESGLLNQCLDRALSPEGNLEFTMTPDLTRDIEVTKTQNRNYALGFGFRMNSDKPQTWELFLRYQAQTERLYRRAIEDFERLVALRPTLENSETAEQPNEPNSAQPASAQPDPASSPKPDSVVRILQPTPIRPLEEKERPTPAGLAAEPPVPEIVS